MVIYLLRILQKPASNMGIESIELLGEKDWAVVRNAGLNVLLAMPPTGVSRKDLTGLRIMKS